MGIRFITVQCCYCGLRQPGQAPPALISCKGCGHDFRIFPNRAGLDPIELSAEAKALLSKPRGAT